MSKYKLSARPSNAARYLILAATVISLFILIAWPPVIHWVWRLTVLLGVAWLAINAIKAPMHWQASVSDEGDWQFLKQQGQAPLARFRGRWQICPQSRLTFLCIWVRLAAVGRDDSQWLWVFPDSLDEDSYRRLARIVIRLAKEEESQA